MGLLDFLLGDDSSSNNGRDYDRSVFDTDRFRNNGSGNWVDWEDVSTGNYVPFPVSVPIKGNFTGHQENHDYWHNCAIFHIVSGMALTISVSIHIYGHWGWYKSLFQKGLGNKSIVTVLLSVLMLATIITGLTVLCIHQDPNYGHGLWHYAIGIILTILGLCHFFKRHHILVKGMKKINK